MTLTVSVNKIVENSKNPLLGIRRDWKRVCLGQIASVVNGFAFKSAQFAKRGGVPLVRIRDVGSHTTDTHYIGEFDDRYVVEPGDLLIGMDGDFNCARWKGPRALLNQRVCKVSLQDGEYHPRFLDYVLPAYLKAINDATSSVTVKHLSSRSVEEIPLPFPSLAQQNKIVARIEKQSSRLDQAIGDLKSIKVKLQRYRFALLNAVVEGHLVVTEAELARREGREFETGTHLLKHILDSRRTESKSSTYLLSYDVPRTSALPALPLGWSWSSVAQVMVDTLIGLDRGRDSQNVDRIGVPYIKMNNVSLDGEVHWDNLVFVEADSYERERYLLSNGDILFNTRNSKELVGKTGLVRNPPTGAIYNNT